MSVYFVTVNSFKASEAKTYVEAAIPDLRILDFRIQEILHIDLEVIVKDKVLKAYKHIGLPCVVEHGGLCIDALEGLPGGLSKVVWDTIGDKLCSFLPVGVSQGATAKSVIGYCDGKKVYLFTGETRGSISQSGRGDYKFQWDPIFIPDGSNQTYAEMGFPKKKAYSQAAKAWNELIQALQIRSVS